MSPKYIVSIESKEDTRQMNTAAPANVMSYIRDITGRTFGFECNMMTLEQLINKAKKNPDTETVRVPYTPKVFSPTVNDRK